MRSNIISLVKIVFMRTEITKTCGGCWPLRERQLNFTCACMSQCNILVIQILVLKKHTLNKQCTWIYVGKLLLHVRSCWTKPPTLSTFLLKNLHFSCCAKFSLRLLIYWSHFMQTQLNRAIRESYETVFHTTSGIFLFRFGKFRQRQNIFTKRIACMKYI